MSAGYKFLEPFFFDLATKAALARRDNGAPAAVECGQCHPPAALPLRIMSFFFVCSLGCPEVGHSKLIFTAHFFFVCPRGPLLLLQSSASLSCFCATQLFGGAQGGIGVRRHKSAKLAEILPPVDVACHWRFFGKNSKPAADLLAGKKKE